MSRPSVIHLNLADLASFQCHVAFSLAFALDRRGLLDRFDLADELAATLKAVPEGAARELVEVLICGLRGEAEPPQAGFSVIRGGKA
jgi:hypothetical protein